MSVGFVHLHLHTEYSIIDSVVRVKSLVAAAAEAGMPAVAMTDQNNLFAMVKFYRSALQAGLKPLIGADIWLVDDRADEVDASRLILLCRDNDGYRNLSELLTRAYREGQRNGVPTLRRSWLDGATDGLMALSGAREGAVGRLLLADKLNEARLVVEDLRELFGGDFYLELQRTGRPQEEEYIHAAVTMAAETGCPVVATNDVRFIRPEDYEAHEARVCIQQGRVLGDTSRPRDYGERQYLRTPEEMAELFADLPEALENTVEIAKRCTVELSLGESHLPEYSVPDGMTTDEFLASEAAAGLCERLSLADPADAPEQYRQRLETELGVIRKMGFPGYFLIVADFIRWAGENGVPVGPGRGSGAGSLVAWVLGITDLDPIEHELLFERFLNPERVSMPDFDIDFCMEGRDRVIGYVGDRYGRDRVSQIITYGTMAAKAVVRDVGRILSHPYGFVDRIAKLIPFEVGMTLDKALEQEQELSDLCRDDEEVRIVIDLARQLEGLVRNAGKHAGGVVIAPSTITDFTPLFQVDGEDATVTQFDKDDVEAAGLVKFDFLGLRTLTIIDHAVRTINASCIEAGEPPVDIRKLPMDDRATFELLQAGNTTAVFQLESRGMRDLVKRLRPDQFDDIVALVALYRPGPMQSGMVDDYVERKHAQGAKQIDYFHPDLEPVLASTYGVILYQEQVMQIAQRLSGYSLGRADILRRAMGKKKPEEMAKQRSGFVGGATERGVDAGLATKIFDLVEKFAGYGFNKSHSAAYALLSYQTAWLKAHYSAALMAAVMTSEMDDTDRLVIMKRDCEQNGLTLLPPDINDSGSAFEMRDAASIRYGLGALKGLGHGAADQIIAARADGPFRSLDDFCERVHTHKVGRRAIEALIKSGAMDAFGPNRPSLLTRVPTAIGHAERAARARDSGQDDLFAMPGSQPEPTRADSGAEIAVESDWSFRDKLEAERESLGLYMSGHPFDEYRHDGPFVSSGTLSGLTSAPPPKSNGNKPWSRGSDCSAAGLVTGLRRRGGRVTFELDDGVQRLEVTLFQDAYDRFRHLLTPESIVVVSGKIRFDDFINGWRLNGKEVADIDRVVESKASSLIIRWTEEANGELDPARLKSILEPYRPGGCAISLYYLRGDAQARVLLGRDWAVRPSRELREQLMRVVGDDGYRFIYQTLH
ncbi:MAG: DNA polymerase III subunit alpha [Gammaproteobacteria bacterium]|nr:DNA polymerase III subunit alpha [Gammaproteobacteria bacterium]